MKSGRAKIVCAKCVLQNIELINILWVRMEHMIYLGTGASSLDSLNCWTQYLCTNSHMRPWQRY